MPGVSLGAGPLQVRDRMQFLKDYASDNAALQPITFASKSLTSVGTHYSSIEKELII